MFARSSWSPILCWRLALMSVVLFPLWLLGCSDDKSPVRPAPAEADSTWTFMLYSAADGNVWRAMDHLPEIPGAHSGTYVNVLGLQDTPDDVTKIWRVDESNDLVMLEELGELSTGAEETVYDFVTYAKENYPADRYIMSFYGHGGAWFGCCGDASQQDGLRLHEIKGALSRAGGVDFVFFTAPCLMGCVETAYELRDCTDIFIASEGLSNFSYWDYALECAFTEMHETPTISSPQLAELIIEEMENDWEPLGPWGPDTMLTMCAVRTDKMEGLKDAIDFVAMQYLAKPDTFRIRVEAVSGEVTMLDPATTDPYMADLNSLVRHMLIVETDRVIRHGLQILSARLRDAVFAECYSTNWTDLGGLSIFFPPGGFPWMSYYVGEEDIELDFANDTHWDELTRLLIDEPAILEPGAESQMCYIRNGTVRRFPD